MRCPNIYRAAVLLGTFAGLRVAEVIRVTRRRRRFHPWRRTSETAVARRPLKTPGNAAPIPIPRDLALLLSPSVKQYPSQMMMTNGAGTDRRGP